MLTNKTDISPGSKTTIVYVVLALSAFAAFGQTYKFAFLNLDDNLYVTENIQLQSGFTLEFLRWAFTTNCGQYWQPLTWLSLMLDYQIFGLTSGGYHITNVILHTISTLLLFWLFNRMTGAVWKSAFVAAFFALHPLHVEAVAWIAKRRDILCVCLTMLTLCLYARYAEKPSLKRYIFVFMCFTCALMSKPMVVTLPLIMILLDYWPLERFDSLNRKTVVWQLREKIPFFILSAVFSVIAFHAHYDPAMKPFSFVSRIENAFVSFAIYLEKIFWPHDLVVMQVFSDKLPMWLIAGSAVLITAISIVIMAMMKRLPYLFVGWMWFAIIIGPTLGIIQYGHLSMSDHHTYISSIGISIVLAWCVPLLIAREDIRRKFLFPVSTAVLVILLILTWKQCGYWINNVELFSHTIQINKDNYLAYNNRGTAYSALGQYKNAIDDFNATIRISPSYDLAYNNRGVVYDELGRYDLAIADFNEAIRLNPGYDGAYVNREIAYAKMGKPQPALESVNYYSKIISRKQGSANAYYYGARANAYAELGQYQLAINDYNRAIRLKPDFAENYYNRGTAYAETELYQLAIEDFNKAIILKNNYIEAYNNRGIAHARAGHYDQAVRDFSKAILLKPDVAESYVNRGGFYLSRGENAAGCRDAQKACELGNCKLMEHARFKGYCR